MKADLLEIKNKVVKSIADNAYDDFVKNGETSINKFLGQVPMFDWNGYHMDYYQIASTTKDKEYREYFIKDIGKKLDWKDFEDGLDGITSKKRWKKLKVGDVFAIWCKPAYNGLFDSKYSLVLTAVTKYNYKAYKKEQEDWRSEYKIDKQCNFELKFQKSEFLADIMNAFRQRAQKDGVKYYEAVVMGNSLSSEQGHAIVFKESEGITKWRVFLPGGYRNDVIDYVISKTDFNDEYYFSRGKNHTDGFRCAYDIDSVDLLHRAMEKKKRKQPMTVNEEDIYIDYFGKLQDDDDDDIFD